MKNIHIILFVLVVALVSCDQDNIGTLYEPGGPYVAFTSPIVPGNLLSEDNNFSVSVQIARSDLDLPTTAQVVLETNDDIEGVFELESNSINFEEGVGTAVVKIIPAIDPNLIDVTKTYEFNLTLVGENVSELYNQTTYRASFALTFESIGTGTFKSEYYDVYYERPEWTVEVEKAVEAEVYRILDCYEEGYDIIFSVDEENNIRYSTQQTGEDDPTYGMVSLAMPDSEEPDSYYYSEPYREDDTFYLLGRMIVEAGSFGHWYEILTLD